MTARREETPAEATQALLPPEQVDHDAAISLWLDVACTGLMKPGESKSDFSHRIFAEHLARHRQSHSLPGDVRLREALEKPWSWPCPAGDEHCCCDCEECCDCERPRTITPDWLNADTCIENVMEALNTDTLFSEDGPVDTMVSSGDLMVILSLAGAAFHARAALTPSALSGEEQARKIARDVCERRSLKRDNGLVYGAALEAAKAAFGLSARPEEEPLGRFGHHPDPAIDFEYEVEQIESIVADLEKGMRQGERVPLKRIELAMAFRVGGDPSAVAAKATLRELRKRASALSGDAGEGG